MHVIERKACAASVGALVGAQYSLPLQDARAPFWASRDYLIDAAKIRAATFIIHGLDDWNVKPTNAGHLWAALPRSTPKALWWFRGAHADPAQPDAYGDLPFPFDEQFRQATHRWFAQFLKGMEAGARMMPPVRVQAENGRWWDARRWPPPARDTTYFLSDGALTGVAGGDRAVLSRAGELQFVSARARSAQRLAGQAYVRLTYMLPAGGDVTFAATLLVHRADGTVERIAAGWARGAHRAQIARRGPSWPTDVSVHAPGEPAVVAFPLWHHDVVVRKGERLELLLATANEHTDSGTTSPEVVIELNGQSKLVVPIGLDRRIQLERARLRSPAWFPAVASS
jgi:X-Pro dipeptidyl-peptidase